MRRAIIEPRSYLERPPISWIFSYFGISQAKQSMANVRDQMATKWGLNHNLWSAVEAGEVEAEEYFEQWKAKVIELVPEDRLLIYNVEEGWDPLAKFLNRSVPSDKPFPKINDADTVQLVVKGSYWILILVLPCVILLLSTCKLRRRLFERSLLKIVSLMKRHNGVRYSPIHSNTV